MKFGIVIPHYNNGTLIGPVLDGLASFELDCIVIDDGSSPMHKEVLAQVAARDWIRVTYRDENGGKGAAVRDGLLLAEELGWDYAIQIDADGQHNIGDVPRLVQLARENPGVLVLAKPEYPAGAPLGRLVGRQISKFWVWIETLSFAIADPLCGLRAYPVPKTCAVLRKNRLGLRMDFDPEIAVRLVWSGLRVVNVPSVVLYPEDGISSFRMVKDNVRISLMHTKLVCEMLCIWPLILKRRLFA